MIGLCCQYLEPRLKRNGQTEYINILNEKTLQFNAYNSGKYSEKTILEAYLNNLDNLHLVLKRVYSEGIRSFRVSSGLIPLFDIVPEKLSHHPDVLQKLNDIGSFVMSHDMRVSSHPDQYTVLSSDNPNVITNSIKILNYHAWVFDRMGLPATTYYPINIHGGKRDASAKLVNSILSLPESVLKRLTLENDESSYSVSELLPIAKETGVPICFDSHHHTFRTDGLEPEEACVEAISTWGEVKPMTHLSNTTPGKESGSFRERRKHSDYVHYIPEYQLKLHQNNKIDIEFEFKMKNLSIFKALKDFSINLS